jgi:hypothetical protein
MAAIAFGFTMPEGLDPALNASTSFPPNILAKAWLIWLLLLFSTHTNRILFFTEYFFDFRRISAKHQ